MWVECVQAVVRPEVGKGGGGKPFILWLCALFLATCKKKETKKNEKEKEHTHTKVWFEEKRQKHFNFITVKISFCPDRHRDDLKVKEEGRVWVFFTKNTNTPISKQNYVLLSKFSSIRTIRFMWVR